MRQKFCEAKKTTKSKGAIAVMWKGRLQPRPAYRIGNFWAVNAADDYPAHVSPYYNVTHKATGLKLTGYSGLRRAQKLVGVLDVIMPTDSESKLSEIWKQLPTEIQQALR